jgi:ABC-type amino acid transport substrate-binding protein
MKHILAVLTSIALLCGPVVVAETNAPAKPPLRVGVSPNFPPMVFKQGKELAGVEVDLARALGERLGRKVEFVEVPWKDQIEKLNAGKTDIIMSSMSVTTARRYMVNFSTPYSVVGQMALVRRENAHEYLLGFPSKPGGTIGVMRATTGEFMVQRDFPKSKYKAFDSETAGAEALIKKKIGLFISDSTLVWYLAGMHAADGLTVVALPLSEERLAWAVRKTDDALLAEVNAFVADSNKDGTILKTLRRWTAIGE